MEISAVSSIRSESSFVQEESLVYPDMAAETVVMYLEESDARSRF